MQKNRKTGSLPCPFKTILRYICTAARTLGGQESHLMNKEWLSVGFFLCYVRYQWFVSCFSLFVFIHCTGQDVNLREKPQNGVEVEVGKHIHSIFHLLQVQLYMEMQAIFICWYAVVWFVQPQCLVTQYQNLFWGIIYIFSFFIKIKSFLLHKK